MTCDKLIFPLAITRILHHFSVPFPVSDDFHVMCAIDAATVKRSEMQFRSRRFGTVALPIPSASSTSTPFSSMSGVTLEDIMAQFQRMDACLDTFSDELCQVNTRVGRIARRQAEMGGYTVASSPVASADKSDGSGSVDDDEDDGNASSSSANEMST